MSKFIICKGCNTHHPIEDVEVTNIVPGDNGLSIAYYTCSANSENIISGESTIYGE
jgi:hypothetical protein